MDIQIRVTGLKEMQARYANAPQIVTDELTTAMRKVTLMGERESKLKAPKWRHQLTRSITSTVSGRPGLVTGFWGTSLLYARFKEYGTRRHFVPAQYIGDWAQAHGFGYRGLIVSGKAQPFIRPAFELVKPRVGPEFRAAIKRAVSRIRGG